MAYRRGARKPNAFVRARRKSYASRSKPKTTSTRGGGRAKPVRRRRRRPAYGKQNIRGIVNKAINDRFKDQWTYSVQETGQILANSGTQSFKIIGKPLADARDIWQCYYRALKGFAPLGEILGTPTSFNAGQQITVAETTDKVRVDYCELNYRVTNADLAQATVTAYYCMPRRDIAKFGGLDMANSLLNGWQATGMTVSSIENQGLALTPFMSPNFCRAYKIYAKKVFLMAPGASMSLTIKNRARTFSGGYLFPEETSTDHNGLPFWYLGKYSKFILFSVTAQAVHDAATPTTVSTSDCRLDLVLSRQYKFSKLPAQQRKNYDISGTLTNITTEQIIAPATQVSVND